MRQSHSHLKLYAQCPRAEHQKYHEDLPEFSSDEARRGSREHKVFCDYGKHCHAEGVPTDLDYIRGRLGTDEDLAIYEQFADTHLFDPAATTLFEVTIDVEVGGYEFRAVIDLIEVYAQRVVVTDYKTDHKIRSQADVEQDPQLRRYAVVASKKFPDVPEFLCRMDFVRHGVVREILYTADQVEAFEAQLIADIVEVENATEWPATGGTYCDWCSYTKGCPVIEAGNLDVVHSLEEAEAAAGQFIALEARRNAVKAPLAEWCSMEGAVTVNGKDVGHFPQRQYEYPDLAKLRTLCAKHGIDFDCLLKADNDKIKKAVKANPEFGEALKSIAVDKSKTVFKSKKAVAA